MRSYDEDPHEQHRCECTNGMREVTETYARQEAGLPQPPASLDEWEHADKDSGEFAAWCKYRAILNSVYPCPACRPDQFKRWRDGCFLPNHSRKSCRRCSPKEHAA